MTIEVLLFASAVDLSGQRSLTVEVAKSATLADVADAVGRACPQLSTLLRVSRWAVDREFMPLTSSVSPDNEIALIPPVSGG